MTYYADHRQDRLNYQRAYRIANHAEVNRKKNESRQKERKAKAEYKAAHWDEILLGRLNRQKESEAKWRAANRETMRRGVHQWRTRKRGLPDTFTVTDWKIAVEHFNSLCAYCQKPSKRTLQQDHYIPLASPHCPGTTPENIVPACAKCNCTKNDIEPHKWLVHQFGVRRAKIIETQIERYFITLRLTAIR